MAEVQVAVRLGREAGAQLGGVERGGGVIGGGAGLAGPVALGMLAGGEVGFDDVADEIGGGGDFRFVGAAHGETSDFNRAILTGAGRQTATIPP